jgi:hypothetical protein
MSQLNLPLRPEDAILAEFRECQIEIQSLERRDYPEESIFVVQVLPEDFQKAQDLGNSLDHKLQELGTKGFVTVRRVELPVAAIQKRLEKGIGDSRVTELVTLLTARSRTSEVQPSLDYIPDTASNVNTVIAPRHQLIFGRRGAGKTALMVEAKRRVTANGDVTVWVNLQTLRLESVERAFTFVCQRICDALQGYFASTSQTPHVLSQIAQLKDDLNRISRSEQISGNEVARLIPRMQLTLRRFADSSTRRVYIFIDELHYFERALQPNLLDAIHGVVRDCDAWIKIAGIRHLSRWFKSNPPLGLQTGHDAEHIDLDITLETPSKAKEFLEKILSSYARSVGITALYGFIMAEALDRLVLASGAVPRDYLVLCADAVRQAKRRERAKVIGVQDINKAAGEAAKVKLSELEDDTASAASPQLIDHLNVIRRFCIDEKRYTIFRVDFRDKEKHPQEYNAIQDLMDLRLLHLIDSSLSDEKEAGRRSEVYMIDLSQYSGQRLKKNLKALDFKDGHLVLKATGSKEPAKSGGTPKQRLGILRRAPLFDLKKLL